MPDRPALHRVVPVPFPEGVASSDGSYGFVELRTGGVAALDLATGQDRWIAATAARPRLVVDDLLVAEDRARSRDHQLQFVTFQIESDGRIDRELEPVRLPDWIVLSDPDQPFEYDVWAESSELVVEWRANAFYSGGAPPPPHIEAQARRQSSGTARVDLSVSTSRDEAAANRAAVDLTAAEIAKLVPADAQSPCVVGGRLVYLRGGMRAAPLELVCVDLGTAKTKWTRSLPDSAPTRPPARRM